MFQYTLNNILDCEITTFTKTEIEKRKTDHAQ